MRSVFAVAAAVGRDEVVAAVVGDAPAMYVAAYSPAVVVEGIEVASMICDCPGCMPAVFADAVLLEAVDMAEDMCFLVALVGLAVSASGLHFGDCRKEDSENTRSLAEVGLDADLEAQDSSSSF